jgi:hypothetical protein
MPVGPKTDRDSVIELELAVNSQLPLPSTPPSGSGGGTIVGGLLYWGLLHVLATGGSPAYGPDTDRSGRDGAIICGAVGALLEAAGIALMSGHTSVQVHE